MAISASNESHAVSSSRELRQQVNKRLTLNLLIQGAAAHSFLTAHHLVRDDLEQLRPGLTSLYDQMALCGMLNYFIGELVLISGSPSRFWSRTHRPEHPFHENRLLAEHGQDLTDASKRYLLQRAWQKGVIGIPVAQVGQLYWLLMRVGFAERGNHHLLADLAKRATSLIWGIETDRLDAEFTTIVQFGNIREPKTATGRFIKQVATGYGGVQQRNGRFIVVAKSWFWPLVAHELIKGTAELVCLHGLSDLSESDYAHVIDAADRIEYETWMLQAGSEMWRRFLAAVPRDRTLAETLMHVARLAPEDLEEVMLAVAGQTPGAAARLAECC